MAAGTLIKVKRKAGAFVGTDLAAGELGIDTTNGHLYYSHDGTTVKTPPSTRTGVYRQLWVGASAMVPRTTNGAAVGTAELATNDIMLDVLDFDNATEEGAGFWVNFGDQWDAGTVKIKAYWTTAAGNPGQTVKWDFAAQSYANDDAIDQALGTEQGVTDTMITANDMHISSASSALTIADATAGEPVYFQVARDVASDSLAVDARLIGVMIQYLESATEQSAW